PHAQLFLSREGAGGLPVALALASYIMCENRLPNDSCGTCSHCRKSHKYIHPDIHYSFPVVRQGDKKEKAPQVMIFYPNGVPYWIRILLWVNLIGLTLSMSITVHPTSILRSALISCTNSI
ncbi:MAG TPA: hypothetical protein PK611_00650, partial [Saprospiraceae bacterium]|nr:hypothetical protein [Saprospiraceae bacterium]